MEKARKREKKGRRKEENSVAFVGFAEEVDGEEWSEPVKAKGRPGLESDDRVEKTPRRRHLSDDEELYSLGKRAETTKQQGGRRRRAGHRRDEKELAEGTIVHPDEDGVSGAPGRWRGGGPAWGYFRQGSKGQERKSTPDVEAEVLRKQSPTETRDPRAGSSTRPYKTTSQVIPDKSVGLDSSTTIRERDNLMDGDQLKLDLELEGVDFDEIESDLGSDESSELKHANVTPAVEVVGIYADRFEEKDDWGSDFDFEPEVGDNATTPYPKPKTSSSPYSEKAETRERPVRPSDLESCRQLLLWLEGQNSSMNSRNFEWISSQMSAGEFLELQKGLSCLYDEDIEQAKADTDQVLDWKVQLAIAEKDMYNLSLNLLKQTRLARTSMRFQEANSVLSKASKALEELEGTAIETPLKIAELKLEMRAQKAELELDIGNVEEARSLLKEAIEFGTGSEYSEGLRWRLMAVEFLFAKSAFTENDVLDAADSFAKYILASFSWLYRAYERHGDSSRVAHRGTSGSREQSESSSAMKLSSSSAEDLRSPEEPDGLSNTAVSGIPIFVPSVLTESLIFLTDCFVTFEENVQGLSIAKCASLVASCFDLKSMEEKAARDWKDIEDLLEDEHDMYLNMDSDEGDWDVQIAAELNVEIVRCSENVMGFSLFHGTEAADKSGTWPGDRRDMSSRLVETEVQQFVADLIANADSKKKIQLFPPPTKPFDTDKRRNADQLEFWTRNFVRMQTKMELDPRRPKSKQSAESLRTENFIGMDTLGSSMVWFDPMRYYLANIPYVEKFSSRWAYIHMETCWRLLRTMRNVLDTQRQNLRLLLRDYFSELRVFVERIPIFDESERRDRFMIFWYNLRMCGMARRLLTRDGMEARGYLQYIEHTRASIPRDPLNDDEPEAEAANLAVDLHIVDTYAHCGRAAVTPPFWGKSKSVQKPEAFNIFYEYEKIAMKAGAIWRKWKLKLDSGGDNLVVIEELGPIVIYASALSNLYLVSVGLSPLDLSETKRSVRDAEYQSQDYQAVDVQSIHTELQKLYPKVKSPLTKSRLAFAMAHHAGYITHEYNLAERLLYDSLTLLHAYNQSSSSEELPDSLVTDLSTENTLKRYGETLLHNAKYRYSIAAFEAAMDARILREPNNRLSFSHTAEVANVSLGKSDYRHALRLLYPLREHLHPKDGNRNEFSRYCLLLSTICSDAGCFKAAMEPLRAYSMLLAEEHFLNLSKMKFLSDISSSNKSRVIDTGISSVTNLFRSEVRQDISQFQRNLNMERFQVDILMAKLLIDKGDFKAADVAISDLERKQIPFGKKYECLYLRGINKFNRGEISASLELFKQAEMEYEKTMDSKKQKPTAAESNGVAQGEEDSEDMRGKFAAKTSPFLPDIVFYRLRALICGERYFEALDYIQEVLPHAPSKTVRTLAKLHYYRGKVLHALQFYKLEESPTITASALSEIEESERLQERVDDELLAAKANLLRLKVSLEWLITQVEVRKMDLRDALYVTEEKSIDLSELESILMSLVVFYRKLQTPLPFVDSLLCLAELRYLASRMPSVWSPWLKLAWDMLAHLFLDKHCMHVVTRMICPLTTLFRLKKLFERMVRLAMFDDRGVDVKMHIRIFEAYLRIEEDIKKRLNIAEPYKHEPKKKRKFDQRSYYSSDPQGATLIQLLGDGGVDITRQGYRLFLNTFHTLQGTGKVLLMASLPELYLKLNATGEMADEEIALGIAAVKVLNKEKTPFSSLMKHIVKHHDDIYQIYEPGSSDTEKVLSSIHQMKANAKKYSRGEIALDDMCNRNAITLRSWMRAGPRGGSPRLNIPDHIWHHLFFILNANRLIGYYSVESGRCVRRFPFGGFEVESGPKDEKHADMDSEKVMESDPRPPTATEYGFLFDLVQGKDQSENGVSLQQQVQKLGQQVFAAPRQLFRWNKSESFSKGRPALLLVSHSLLPIPWELFFDHLIIRALCLIDLVRGMQPWARSEVVAPSSRTADRIKYLTFCVDKNSSTAEISEQARKDMLSYQVLYRLSCVPPDMLVSQLKMRGFNKPRSVDAVARPMGPINSPLSKNRRTIFGLKTAWSLGSSFPHINFVKIPWLASISSTELKEAVLKQHQASVYIFLFTFADLVDAGGAVFGLYREVRNCIVLLTTEPNMPVLAKHLVDWEVDRKWLFRQQGIKSLHETLKLLLQTISSFSRERQIPIVQFLGENLVEPIMRNIAKEGGIISQSRTNHSATLKPAYKRSIQRPQ